MLSVVGVIGIGSLFPAYVKVSFEERGQAALLQGDMGGQASGGIAEMTRELQEDTMLMRELSRTLGGQRPSTLVKDVVSARGSVKIQSIVVSDISTTSAVMVIQGVAATRESLVSFKTRLENMSVGNKVELPISELAKSKDIPFSLRFTRVLP
ncbi:MAG: hypothetical protein KBC33_01615 [Candidatus Pacebacteria bacterium]|nr:hypothetical protein [Candidatus Paceibacterota bacterium]